jgi:hypothetical protein
MIASLALSMLVASTATPAAIPTSPHGTGRYPAEKRTEANLPHHTIYAPRDLSADGPLPILAWANGGCRLNGSEYSPFLKEIASNGYLVIAIGAPGPDPVIRPELPRPATQMDLPPPNPTPRPRPDNEQVDKADAEELLVAIDWAIAENSRAGSRYQGRVNVSRIAVMGTSCGGLQTLSVSNDPRITTSIVGNSGIGVPSGKSSRYYTKDNLKDLHAPVIIINGGPTDMAYENGRDNFERIDHVPVVFANIDVGHSGTYRNANGGKSAPVTIAWLDWHLKGKSEASAMFRGPDCGLCKNPEWTIARKGID